MKKSVTESLEEGRRLCTEGDRDSALRVLGHALQKEPLNKELIGAIIEAESPLTDPDHIVRPDQNVDIDTYARLKIAQKKIADLARFVELKYLYIDVSNYCNYKCHHCRTWVPDAGKFHIPLEDIEAVLIKVGQGLESIERITGRSIDKSEIMVQPQGYGEPLMYPHFEQTLKLINDYGFAVKLNTNGSLLSGRRADLLAEANIKDINVSIDASSPEMYAKFRKGGDLRVVTENLEAFIARFKGKAQRPTFAVSFCNAPLNSPELHDFCRQWAHKVDRVFIQRFRDYTKDKDTSRDDEIEQIGMERHFCNRLPGYLTIKSNGDAISCVCGTLNVGNIFTQSFEDVFLSGKRLQTFHCQETGKYDDIDACRDCRKWYEQSYKSNTGLLDIDGTDYLVVKSFSSTTILNQHGHSINKDFDRISMDDPDFAPPPL
ncbi:radical SAM/SPASM domain-containing protein [Desulfovibrio sp. JC010]|uniref:radical SAM/SPASM domain-containing protein n=1 Tax=Desulfovibrio sp. JC010 TaxID=2593641 RepID=UPI0013D354F9|nr:radical SAM/SPASM domain-containing protein [Desulfovibrio sp. JC010]NDV25714.1 radical SAM protein [Desulfovibrio sp. JC010]